MPRPSAGLFLLFPILGSLLAGHFRTSESGLRSYAPPQNPRLQRDALPLPNGAVIPLIAVPGPDGAPLFFLGETEISRRQWRAMDPAMDGPGFAATVSFDQALAYCGWLSGHSGRSVRLPAREEWTLAAAGGLQNAETPWGYNSRRVPLGVAFKKSAPPRHPGQAFGYGFRDMAGGVWEWTRDGRAAGGAWAESNPRQLRLDALLDLPPGYQGGDIGFRILVEADR